MLPQNRMPTPGYISPSVGMLKTDEKIDHQKQCSNPQSIPGTVLFLTLCYACADCAVTTICLWLAHITFGYDIHVTVIPARDICLSHLLMTSACHTCLWHLPVTPAHDICLSHLLMTSACRTCSWHLPVTPAHDICLSRFDMQITAACRYCLIVRGAHHIWLWNSCICHTCSWHLPVTPADDI